MHRTEVPREFLVEISDRVQGEIDQQCDQKVSERFQLEDAVEDSTCLEDLY